MFRFFDSFDAFIAFLSSPHSETQKSVEESISSYLCKHQTSFRLPFIPFVPLINRLIKKINSLLICRYEVMGFCVACNKTQIIVADLSGIPNRKNVGFRERMECVGCGLNNRQRLMMAFVVENAKNNTSAKAYVLEQVTPFFKAISKHIDNVTGSEYWGETRKPGEIVNGSRHEDCMNLSFENESFDMIVSNDVYEHIPDIKLALSEANRVLVSGGTLAFTVPCNISSPTTIVRAGIEGGKVVHYTEPEYHGNYISAGGALAFYTFGRDIFDFLRQAGFVNIQIVCSDDYAYGHYARPWLIAAKKK